MSTTDVWASASSFSESTTIEPELLREILDAARWAPSSFNLQPTRWVVIGAKTRAQIIAAAKPANRIWIKSAAVVLAALAPSGSEEAYEAGIASGQMGTAARRARMAVRFVGGFDHDAVDRALRTSPNQRVLVLCCVGPGTDGPRAPDARLPYDEIVTFTP